MIYFSFGIRFPFKQRKGGIETKNWISWMKMLSKNKCVEFQVYPSKGGIDLIGLTFDWSIRRSHAGVRLDLELFNINVGMEFYDIRHWKYEEGRYETEEEVAAENAEWEKKKKEKTQ